MLSSRTLVNSLAVGTLAVGVAIAQNTALTHAEKDSARLESLEREAEQSAAASIYGIDSAFGGLTRGDVLLSIRGEETVANVDEPLPECQYRVESTSAPVIDSVSVDELRCVWLEASSFGAALGLEWVNPLQSPLSIELYSSTSLIEDTWVRELCEPLPIGSTNCNVSVTWALSGLTQGFLTFGWFIDSDGDGLSNLFEKCISHTKPNQADTDGDGIPDGWEYENGLNPLEDDRMYDLDGDGQTNLEAYLAGMNPAGGDTDGDGLPDAQEVAWMVQGASSVPWFEFSPIKTVYSDVRNKDAAIFACEVPFETEICGTPINVVLADINGIVHLGHSSATNRISSQNSPLYLSRDQTEGCIAIAAYSTDLMLRESLNSSISFGTASFNGVIYFVVEYCRIGTYGGSADDAVSFQVSFPASDANRVYVRYGTLSDTRSNYRISIGAQGAKGVFASSLPKLIYKDRETSTGLSGGEIITYHFGTGTDPFNDDMDGDGLKDGQERYYGTNPRLPDTDFDGLDDGWEVQYGLNPCSAGGSNGANGDPDEDGLTNNREFMEGSHPWRSDTDDDGLTDREEVGCILEANPLPWLSFDSFTDVTSLAEGNGFRLVSIDIPDPLCVQGLVVTNITITGHGWVILNPGGWRRSISLGYAETFQPRISGRALYLAPYVAYLYIRSLSQQANSRIRVGRATYLGARYLLVEFDSMYGSDSDAISFQVAIPVSNSDRAYVRYSNVIGSDMTGSVASIGMQTMDGRHRCSYAYHDEGSVYSDKGLTFVFGTNTDPTKVDSDNDGLSDLAERNIGTNPNRKDTDGDGITDAWELEHGADPLSALDGPANLAAYQNLDAVSTPGMTKDLTFNIYSDYAAWVLEIQGLNDRDRSTRRISMGAPGAGENVTVSLAKGGKYKLSMLWLNCDGHEDDVDAPWYCWQLKIDGKPTEATYEWHAIPRIEGVAEIVSGEGWFVDNRSGLMTNHVHKDSSETSGGNTAEGLEAILYVLDAPKIVPDYNRDGRIDGCDFTAYGRGEALWFWVNDDGDSGNTNDSEHDRPGSGSNATNDRVNGRGDLLDFTPLYVDFSSIIPDDHDGVSNLHYTWHIKSSAVNVVYTNIETNEVGIFRSDSRLLYGSSLNSPPWEATVVNLGYSNEVLIDGAFKDRLNTKGSGVILVEGCSINTNSQIIIACDIDDSHRVEAVLPLKIDSVERMYKTVSLRGAATDNCFIHSNDENVNESFSNNANAKDVFFMHGFNVDAQAARAWGAEIFKRLWQSGSNARFHILPWQGDYSWAPGSAFNGLHYQHNVWYAQRTGRALKRYVESVQSDPSKRILMTQSLGNMVACEALREGLHVGQYYMFDAAIPSEAIDGSLRAESSTDSSFMKYVRPEWRDYPNASWASNWYRLFEDNLEDARGKMGWTDRFTEALVNADEVFNYYSSGDIVFTETDAVPALFDGTMHWGVNWLLWVIPYPTVEVTFENHCWQKQEVLKGMATVAGTLSGGWGFNVWQEYDMQSQEWKSVCYSPAGAAAAIANDSIKIRPAFDTSDAAEMTNPDATEDDVFLALAKHVPALSSAVGGMAVVLQDSIENHNLNNIDDYANGWGRSGDSLYGLRWLHSDMKDMSYYYVYKLYDELIEKGGLR